MSTTVGAVDWLLLEHPVGKVVLGLLHLLALWFLIINGAREASLEDVLLSLGNVGEDLRCEIEILRDDRLGGVGWFG